jgi:hypothetical protein
MPLVEQYLRERMPWLRPDQIDAIPGWGPPTYGPLYDATFRVVEDADCPPGELRAIGPGPDGQPAVVGKIVNVGAGGSDAEEA